ncbi:conserved exported hypothetical protein [Tenacibaculum sediminilitoris]|uniref:hypothetical protein n=1 Tax=Tenacibaculum sediminilitoris TaxID=1820334 RepID=UPI003895AF86
MKKKLFVITFCLLAIFSANAQSISKNTIGLRFGDNNGIGGEFSYQRKLGNINRLELNLGLRNDFEDFKATALYEWVWKLEGHFNWYAGAGGGLINSSGTAIFGAGVIGIEYNFDIPLLISLDYRPEIGITRSYDGFHSDFGLGIRYQF